jgi:hypothetical protein
MVEQTKKNLIFAFTILLITIWLILSRNTWDFVARLLLVAAIVPIIRALLKKEKNKLNLAITLLVLLVIAWLIWMENVSILHSLPLLVLTVAAVKWTLRNKAEPARLLGFFVKTFALFFTIASVAYFIVWLGIAAPHTYSVYPVHAIVETGMVFIFPISFLLEAISIIIYGIYKIKLKAWEIFLSSWCVSVFVILIIYDVWWSIQWTPPPPEEIYGIPGSASLGAGIFALFTIIILSLLPAAICTILYTKYKKPQTQKLT